MCDVFICKTNNKEASVYCVNCLLTNQHNMNEEEIYDNYAGLIDIVDYLVGLDSFENDIYKDPEELKSIIFNITNTILQHKVG